MKEIILNITGIEPTIDMLLSEMGINEPIINNILDLYNDNRVKRERWVGQFMDMTFADFLDIIKDDIANFK